MQGCDRGFLIRELEPGDIPYLTDIGRRQLGVDYISDDDFTEVLSDPGKFCLVSVIDDVPVGFAICREFGPESEGRELALPDGPERDLVLSSKRIGLVDSVAVGESAVGRGIGAVFCSECCERFVKDGCDLAVSMAWVHYDGVEPIRGPLHRAGFTRSELVIRGYWNQWVGSEGGHQCPYCGAPCQCFGAMWHRSLRSGSASLDVPQEPVADIL